METENIYKEGLRRGFTFKTKKGVIGMHQLPSLSLKDLDELAVNLQDEAENGKKKSFLVETTRANKDIVLKFKIVKDLLDTVLQEKNELKEKAEKKARNERILEIIEEKKEGALKEKSIAELEKLLS